MKYIVSILIVLFLFCANIVVAQENPFLQMTGRKYADYAQELSEKHREFILLDTVEALNIIRQVKEAAQKTGSMEWKLQVGYFELMLFKKYGKERYPIEELLSMAWELLEKTKKEDIVHLELMLRYKIIHYYWEYLANYELAFEQCAIQAKRLQTVSTEDIPEKTIYYEQIGSSYYFFKDYAKAIFYYNKVLEEKENVQNQLSKQQARNHMGLSYNGCNELDRADSCFRAIMEVSYLCPNNESFKDIWNGIAEGNLGSNMLRRGEYDKAIPLLKSSIEKMLKDNDYGFACGRALNLAEIYLKTNNLAKAKHYVDLATEYFRISPRNRDLFYEIKSKYYAATGNKELCIIYMDSMLVAKKQYEERFNSILLLHIEQKESALRQQELMQEKKIRERAQMFILILSIGFIVIFSLLGLVYVFYRKKRVAYRELVRRSQRWALGETENLEFHQAIEPAEITELMEQEQTIQNSSPDTADILIMNEIERLMSEEKLYTDVSLSVDLLAQKLGAKRHYVSIAINRCRGKSFSAFVNEYRIKEAIRLLSRKDTENLSIDSIAFNSGFNDRINFYRVFKKMTGLPPTEFRKNVKMV